MLLTHKDDSAENIFGSIDARKVKSCMTLFDAVSPHDIFEEVLNAFYEGKRCKATLGKLAKEAQQDTEGRKGAPDKLAKEESPRPQQDAEDPESDYSYNGIVRPRM